ncbi:hypothetical protein CGCSCA4_v007069 [Colletotrichum siamense]|uniref:Uncharacterized protein n=1 Tax=Colletotrichum siamense TaxID=690259 RepID=A0A9P5K5L7_COLSI|nr:hypothetical protein CGCSCA4_v007069 [Colletotrichum siamense]KAF4859844.1 hypothetical protein CGCSCA2_v005872 [Colletotrichum siamense]
MLVMELEISMTLQASVYQIQQETTTANAVLLDIKNKSDRGILHNQSNILATKTDMNELKSVVEALVASNSDTTLILKKLMSKPDVLKVVCREFPKEHPDQSLFLPDKMSDNLYSGEADGFYESLYCSCNTRRGLKRKTKRSGPAFLVREVVVETPHFSCCPLSDSVQGQSKWSAGISTNVLRGLASVALTVTTSTILGAGGFAISPSFTYLPIRETSPSREALRLLGNAFYEREWSDQDCKSLVWRTIKTIQAGFSSRTSSPLDIDNDGNTLLHDIIITWYRCDSKLPRNEIVKYLSVAGVPRDRPNQARIYPFQAALRSSIAVHTPPMEMFRMLCPDECLLALDVQKAKTYGSQRWPTDLLKAHMEMTFQLPKFAELYSGHPSEAIILRNESALKHALDRKASLSDLNELDAFGNNSLNHLLSWPEGLRLVLNRFGSEVFDAPGETLILEYALFWSRFICNSNPSTKCQNDCACTDVVQLIMDTDAESLAEATSRHFWMAAVISASVKACEVFVERLRDARQQLKALSLIHLVPQEIEQWYLRSPSILDYHTNSVVAALNRKEQLVPRRLATNVEPSNISRSVYRNIAGYGFDGAPIADTFYRFGFHDIDTPDSDTSHPLEIADHPNYVAWLIRHGSRLHAEEHIVAYKLSHCLLGNSRVLEGEEVTLDTFATISSFLCDNWYLDSCICGCSSQGCHPFTSMWTRLFIEVLPEDQHTSTEYLQQATVHICKITAKIETIGLEFDDFKSACLRAFTFAILPLRHTCCSPWSGGPDDVEEGLELREEDAFELRRLEALLKEFEKEMSRLACFLTEFMQTHWSERMRLVLREIEDQRLGEDEIQNIEALDVSLQIQHDDKDAEKAPSEVDYWYRKLDALVS